MSTPGHASLCRLQTLLLYFYFIPRKKNVMYWSFLVHPNPPFRLNILMKVKRGNIVSEKEIVFSPKVNILIPSLTPVPPQAEGHYHRTIRVQGSEIKFTKFMLPFYVTS